MNLVPRAKNMITNPKAEWNVVAAEQPNVSQIIMQYVLPLLAGIVAIAGGIYSIYLWYLGLGPIKKTPEDKKVVYLIVTFLALIVVYVIIGMILSRLLLPVFGIGYGAYGI